MMAQVCVLSGFPPEVFGVENSIELGEAIIDILAEQGRDAKIAGIRSRFGA